MSAWLGSMINREQYPSRARCQCRARITNFIGQISRLRWNAIKRMIKEILLATDRLGSLKHRSARRKIQRNGQNDRLGIFSAPTRDHFHINRRSISIGLLRNRKNYSSCSSSRGDSNCCCSGLSSSSSSNSNSNTFNSG